MAGFLDNADKIASVVSGGIAVLAFAASIVQARRANAASGQHSSEHPSVRDEALSAGMRLLLGAAVLCALPLGLARLVAWIIEESTRAHVPGWVTAFLAYVLALLILGLFLGLTDTGDAIFRRVDDSVDWLWPLILAAFASTLIVIPVGIPAIVGWVIHEAGGPIVAGGWLVAGSIPVFIVTTYCFIGFCVTHSEA
ncbi:hypothetical protein ACWEOZ_15435 [Actinoplanes sp. NPDC004185]